MAIRSDPDRRELVQAGEPLEPAGKRRGMLPAMAEQQDIGGQLIID